MVKNNKVDRDLFLPQLDKDEEKRNQQKKEE